MPVCERLARAYLFMGSIPALDRVKKRQGKKWLEHLDCRFAMLCTAQVHLKISVQQLGIREKRKKYLLTKQFILKKITPANASPLLLLIPHHLPPCLPGGFRKKAERASADSDPSPPSRLLSSCKPFSAGRYGQAREPDTGKPRQKIHPKPA